MFNFLKNTWWIFILLTAGAVVFFLSLHPKPQADQGVILSDIFHQQVPQTESGAVLVNPPKKADPVPPMAIVATPVNGKETGFSIQVYSFQDRERAETALQGLKNN